MLRAAASVGIAGRGLAPTKICWMKLDREVRHKSEDIDDDVLIDAIKAVGRRVRVVNHNYDIPYIAGYSKDGHTDLLIEICRNHSAFWVVGTALSLSY